MSDPMHSDEITPHDGKPWGELVWRSDAASRAALMEIERLRVTLADRDGWMNDQAEQLSCLLLAVPRPLRMMVANRGDRIRRKVYGGTE